MKTLNTVFDRCNAAVKADELFEKHYQSFMNGEAPRYAKAIDFAEDLFDSCQSELERWQVTVALTEALMYYKQKLAAEKAYADRLQEVSVSN